MPPGGTISSVEAIAARQHGVITLLQLLAAGLSRKQIAHRVRTGRLHRFHQGVFAVGHPGVSYEGARWPPCAPASGSARPPARRKPLWRFAVSPAPAHRCGRPKQRRDKDGLRIHHRANLRRGDVTTVDRIPVTRPARMLVDLNDTLTAHQLANVIHQAAYRGLFSALATRDVIARTRRTKTIERALALHESGSAGTRSHNEDRFLALCRREPLVNTVLLDEEVDFFWPDQQLVVEIDGPNHGRPATIGDDARRDAKLRAAGVQVVRFSDSGLDRLAREGAAQQRPELVALVL